MIRLVGFGSKLISFSKRGASLTKVCITEKPLAGEDEDAFVQRLLSKYSAQEGRLEVIFRNGLPVHAIITLA